MIKQYVQSMNWATIKAECGIEFDGQALPASRTINPGALGSILTDQKNGGIVLEGMVWGFFVEWTKKRILRAKAHKLNSKFWYEHFLEHRAVVAADYFLDGKHLYQVRRPDGQPFMLAAVFKPNTSANIKNEFAFIETDAQADYKAMVSLTFPLVLRCDNISEWLHPDTDRDRLADILCDSDTAGINVLDMYGHTMARTQTMR